MANEKVDRSMDFDTLAVRAGIERSQFNEHSEAMYLTSSFVFDNAAQAAARFSGEEEGNVYARFTNPTVTALQKRLAALEGGEACIATASGMAAILATVMALLEAGDHIIASQGLFGSTQQLFTNVFGKFGVDTTFVPATDIAAYAAAARPETRLIFIETPSNPLTELVDIPAVAEIAHRHNALLAVDNCFCTPALQQPLAHGADIVIHSATKFLDGQGRVLGGAVVGRAKEMEEVFRFLRTAGFSVAHLTPQGAPTDYDEDGTDEVRLLESRAGREILVTFPAGASHCSPSPIPRPGRPSSMPRWAGAT